MKSGALASGFGTLLVVCFSSHAIHAQSRPWTGYVQTVPVWSGATPLAERNWSDLGRARLAVEHAVGPVSVSAAYEQLLSLRRRESVAAVGVGTVPGGGEWLDLQWTIDEETHAVWRHRFDRLELRWSPAASVDLALGRQAISWGTTLLLTPADPFVPFTPIDPFREFRAGVDAMRARVYPGPLSEIDLVVRPSTTAAGTELTVLARGLTTWKGWELSGWAGTLYGDRAAAFGAAGSLASWALRVEAVVRDQDAGGTFRGAVGVDRLSQVAGRDLYFIAEYQRDGLGAADANRYPVVLESSPFLRGELQVLGRDEALVQLSYQLHPLWNLSALWIWNLNDRSALISPSFAYSAGNNASITGGIFLGTGSSEVAGTPALPSEYGLSGKTAFFSLSWFF